MEARRAYQILAVRIRNEDAKLSMRRRYIGYVGVQILTVPSMAIIIIRDYQPITDPLKSTGVCENEKGKVHDSGQVQIDRHHTAEVTLNKRGLDAARHSFIVS
ncbi:jg2940 [Pararge aegeria aegeria]|uniref:Jg2940 protein n=1 Tax=Pararge aegeria aegeria TaxID=348720 RepID=A0A8S4SMM8_9NEOP|nr:jg2940 [Pararge aegeria aegeria]